MFLLRLKISLTPWLQTRIWSSFMKNARYEGKPLLRLLDLYVLKAIDMLDQSTEQELRAIEPKLSSIYSSEGTWDQILSNTMGFPSEMPSLIREVWKRNQSLAVEKGAAITPQQFAENFVDRNFV